MLIRGTTVSVIGNWLLRLESFCQMNTACSWSQVSHLRFAWLCVCDSFNTFVNILKFYLPCVWFSLFLHTYWLFFINLSFLNRFSLQAVSSISFRLHFATWLLETPLLVFAAWLLEISIISLIEFLRFLISFELLRFFLIMIG